MSQEIFKVTKEYDSNVSQDYCSILKVEMHDHRFLTVSIESADEQISREITLSPSEVGNLVLVLSDWFDVASRRGR